MKTFQQYCILKEQAPQQNNQVVQSNNITQTNQQVNKVQPNQQQVNKVQPNQQQVNQNNQQNKINTQQQINQNKPGQNNNIDVKQLNNVVAQLKKLLSPMGVKF